VPASHRSRSHAHGAMPLGVEEVAPERCIVRDRRAWPILAGEGERHGMFITLSTTRRAGLAARLRQRGISVAWLDDLIAELAAAPERPPGGTPWHYHPAVGERIARFDHDRLSWVVCDPAPLQVVPGEPLRVRRTRGAPAYARVAATRLVACGADEAHLLGYACASPAQLRLTAHADRLVIPAVALPSAHAALLRRLTQPGPDGTLIAAPAVLPFIAACVARLGVECTATPAPADVAD